MRKILVIWCLFFFLFSFFSSFAIGVYNPLSSGSFDTDVAVTSADTFNTISSGSFDTTVVVEQTSGNMIVNSSGSWDTTIYIEYLVYSDWSDWWVMEYVSDISISDFHASHWNDTCINLSWNVSSNTTHTYIVRKIGSYPASRTDGVFVCNTTNTSFNDTGLHLGTHYFYSAWGYNSSGNVFSNTPATSSNYTNPGCPYDLVVTSVGMNSITLQWNRGVNSTHTLIYMNATGETGYPNKDNGTQVIGTQDETGTAYYLSANTTYWFTAYGYNVNSGLYSLCNDTASDTTLSSADSPYDLVVSRFNHNQLNLSWSKSKPDDDTVVVRKTGGYPSSPDDGTEVYNGSGTSYKDTGLTPATHYYYRAWGWNGDQYSSGYDSDDNITCPEPPQNFTGNIEGDNLVITWDKGQGSVRTVIRNDTGSYPDLNTGYLVYNGTGTSKTVSGVSSINYYRGWSYTLVDGEHVYSLPQNLLWGGLEINVYREDKPGIAIGNYTVFITNSDGTETYQNTSANNPFRIDVDDVPNGDDIIIQVSKQGYKTRSIVCDLYENTWYIIDFYLPASSEGSPSGESGEPWYVNGSDIVNETVASHYIIIVKDEVGNPINNAFVVIKRYINVSDSYKVVLSDYTDSSGQIECDLIPGTVYYVNISHSSGDYVNVSTFWTPSEISYAEDAYKTFYLTATSEEYQNVTSPSECIVFTGEVVGSTGFVNLSNNNISGCGVFYNFSIYVYEINTSTNQSSLFYSCNSTNQSVHLQLSLDVNNTYFVKVFINHSVFGGFWTGLYLNPVSKISDVSKFDDFFNAIFGENNQFSWSVIFGLFLTMCFLFAFGQKNAGLGVMITGFVLLGVNAWLGW